MVTVDLFCGCGGMSKGFELAGHKVVAGLDNWDKALDVYRANFTHPVIKADLGDVDGSAGIIEGYKPDMVIGGPPCQDFSSAGKRNEDNGRGDLTVCYAKIISKVRPEWFVMENVARIVKTNKLVEAKEIFKNAGYGVTQYVLDASLCGVPQARKRFFLIGKQGEEDGFMLPFIERNLSDKPMTIAEYFGDKLDFEYYYRHPRSYVRRGIFSVREPSPTIRGVNRPMPQGYKLHPGDPVKSLDGIRPLTTEERSRIQTFPEGFVFLGSKTDQEQMIGNAVPVNLAKFVGTAINEYIRYKKEMENAVDGKGLKSYNDYWSARPFQPVLLDPDESDSDR
jgi:DNA (cytosine-5)-methyltransferase 1